MDMEVYSVLFQDIICLAFKPYEKIFRFTNQVVEAGLLMKSQLNFYQIIVYIREPITK